MTLPTSGQISLAMIRGEFGGAAPDSIQEYYAGGAFVPGGTEGINGPIPVSGEISISDFYGAPQLVPPTDVTLNLTVTKGQGLTFNDIYQLTDTATQYGYSNGLSGSENAYGSLAGDQQGNVIGTVSVLEQTSPGGAFAPAYLYVLISAGDMFALVKHFDITVNGFSANSSDADENFYVDRNGTSYRQVAFYTNNSDFTQAWSAWAGGACTIVYPT